MEDERIINDRKRYSQLINKSKQQAKKKRNLAAFKKVPRRATFFSLTCSII
jgi:hypothetical protein